MPHSAMAIINCHCYCYARDGSFGPAPATILVRRRAAAPAAGVRGRARAGWSAGRRLGIVIIAALLFGSALTAHAWEIGHRTVTWQDPARGNRSIQTEVYYPADVAGEGVPVGGDGSELFPVVVFGHGFLMTWDVYAFLWQGLTPAGYIVALPRTEGGLLPDHAAFGMDLAFLADELRTEGSNPASFLYQRVAPEAAVSGHSMGGGASILAAADHPGIAAVFNLAAANTNPSAIGAAPAVTAWALLLSGSLDCVTPPSQHQEPIYQSLGSECRTHVTLTGASHCQFAASNVYCNLGEGGCSPPAITRAQQQALTLSLVRPWLDARLRGDVAGWTEFQDILAAQAGITWEQDCAIASTPGLAGEAAPARESLTIAAGPNPFRPDTDGRVRFRLVDRAGGGLTPDARLEGAIYAVDGRPIRMRLPAGAAPGGAEAAGALFSWDGLDGSGRPAPSGIYFVRARLAAGHRAIVEGDGASEGRAVPAGRATAEREARGTLILCR